MWRGASLRLNFFARARHERRLSMPSVCFPRRGFALAGLIACVLSVLAGCTHTAGGGPPIQGQIKVDGSTALQPLTTAAAQLFQQQHAAAIDVQGGGSLKGITDVTSHQVDIGDSDVYADPAAYPDPNLTDHLVCVIPFTMIVNPQVTGVANVTREQIIGIFSTGKYTNWKELGGPDVPIKPIVRPKTSGTRATFRKYILGGLDENGTLLTSDSSQTVRDTVANTPGAIGYLALSVLDASVHAIGIDGQSASFSSITAGHYGFWGYEHMYTLGDDNPLVAAFLDFMLTPQVQQKAQSLGYIPIAAMQLALRAHVAPVADSVTESEVA
jgi:phosphate transport system substrate-binding protein